MDKRVLLPVLFSLSFGVVSAKDAPVEAPAEAGTTELTRSLTKSEAQKALHNFSNWRLKELQQDRQKEFDERSITIGDKTLRYEFKKYGREPKDGRSLYISMHGGGSAPAAVNDQQWKNQISLYRPKEGIYVAPRAPTDTWDLWQQAHIDVLFDRLIENFVAIKGVNPNKVYVMGYSAGGDGTYQLAPRMADRWAGAAMMAGHPGDAQTYNLRNLAYFIQCGGKDTAYDRHKLCAEWGEKLDKLEAENPGAYPHKWIVYPRLGHWMELKCKQAVPWMAKHTRNPWPKKLHWHQDNVTGSRFFWLENSNPQANQLVTAEIEEGNPQTIILTQAGDGFSYLPSITLRLSEAVGDLDKAVTVKDSSGEVLFSGKVPRTKAAIKDSLMQRFDVTSAATATLKVELP